MMDRRDSGLAPTTWCGIVALAVAGAAFFVSTWVGVAVLAVAGTMYVAGCVREGRRTQHR